MEIQIPQILFQILNFAIILAVLTKFLYKPILKTINERSQKIRDGLEAAEKNIKLQTAAQVDKDKILAAAKKEAAQIKKQAQSEAETLVSQAQSEAQQQAKKAMAKQKQAFTAHMNEETKTLEKKMALLVSQATKAVLQETLGSAKIQQQVIDKQIKNLSAAHLS